ncbi:N-acetylglucosamine kinase [Paenibacillus hamazuiensis]|uniref:N-acetylglucosamine kinase n=1 Tax=Paenibacillus hamazuiensis TaxID=2936508 RepID=UPI00200BB8DB
MPSNNADRLIGERRFIGIDGGGTKTACVIGDECGHVLAVVHGDSSNVKSKPWDEVKAVLSGLLGQALKASGSDRSQLAGVFLGLAGTDRPEEKGPVLAYMSELLPPGVPVTLQNDAVTALAAGTWGEAGIVLIAGTGSIACGYLPETQRYVRVGGWGYLLGDEGSGFDIGRQALAAVMRQFDGRGEETALTALALEHFGLERPEQLITYIYAQPNVRASIADASKLVLAAAKQGDAVAERIVSEAIRQLLELAQTVRARLLDGGPAEDRRLPLVLSGGVFADEWFAARLQAAADLAAAGFELRQLRIPPVAGCYILALKQAGIEISEQIRQRIGFMGDEEGTHHGLRR